MRGKKRVVADRATETGRSEVGSPRARWVANSGVSGVV